MARARHEGWFMFMDMPYARYIKYGAGNTMRAARAVLSRQESSAPQGSGAVGKRGRYRQQQSHVVRVAHGTRFTRARSVRQQYAITERSAKRYASMRAIIIYASFLRPLLLSPLLPSLHFIFHFSSPLRLLPSDIHPPHTFDVFLHATLMTFSTYIYH